MFGKKEQKSSNGKIEAVELAIQAINKYPDFYAYISVDKVPFRKYRAEEWRKGFEKIITELHGIIKDIE